MSQFKVLDMSCGHCEKAITGALKKASVNALIEVDLQNKIVDVKDLSDDTVLKLLKDLGYSPEKVK